MRKKSLGEKFDIVWNEIRLKNPFPVRLPWGDRWFLKSDALSQAILSREGFEPSEQNFLNSFLKPGMVVFDIGAHQGFFTLLSSHKIGPSGKVFAFEPSPREHASLKKHLKINQKQNVAVEQIALSDFEGTAEFYVCLGKETGCNSLHHPDVSDKTSVVVVNATTLDKYLSQTAVVNIDFIKMDVEGAELSVLKGAGALFAQKPRPIFLCEISDVRTKPWGYKACEIFDFFYTNDFQWFSITESGLLRKSVRKEKYHENLVAIPNEKLSVMADLITSENS